MELKPCPFCGSPGEIEFNECRHHNEERGEEHRWMVGCSASYEKCHVQPTSDCTTEEEAIRQWNTRASPAPDTKGDEGVAMVRLWAAVGALNLFALIGAVKMVSADAQTQSGGYSVGLVNVYEFSTKNGTPCVYIHNNAHNSVALSCGWKR